VNLVDGNLPEFVDVPPCFLVAAIRLQAGRVLETVPHIEAAWSQAVPDFPMSYRFLDDDFDALYRSERRLGQLLAGSAGGACQSGRRAEI